MPLLDVRDLSVRYGTAARSLKAVDHVSFHLNKGEILGMVGESGAGKTSIVLSLLRLVPGEIESGQMLLDGVDLRTLSPVEIRRMRGRRLAYVPQAAMNSLNPVMTIGAHIREALWLQTGARGEHPERRMREVLAMVDLGADIARRYPHELSGGMRQRAVIAMALAPKPQVLLADEPTSGLDVIIRAQILRLLTGVVAELGLSLLLVSHDLRLVSRWCDRALVMYAGRIVEEGPASGLLSEARHPYAWALARSLPTLRGPRQAVSGIGGEAPDLAEPPQGCRFHPRCPRAMSICSEREPLSVSVGDRRTACHLYG